MRFRSGSTNNNLKRISYLRSLLVEPLESRRLLASITLTPNKDNTLFQTTTGSVSDGIGNSMAVGLNHSDLTAMRAVLAFDVAGSVPAGATIDSVSLSVWENLTFADTTPTVELHKVTTAWGEGNSQPRGFMPPYGASQAGDATWIHSNFPNVRWTTAGGDFVSTVSASKVFAGAGSYSWNTTSQMVADVQSWLSNPSSNFGWLMKGDETKESGKLIDTRESTTASHRPSLTINYTPALTAAADLTILKSHVGSFRQGDAADNYAIVVTNSGTGSTSGMVTVVDSVPTGLTPTVASGTGWSTSISGNVVTATRNDVLTQGTSYPTLQVTVSVANNASASLANTATVSGGGESNVSNDTSVDITAINGIADLSLTKSHLGTFRQGDTADNYSITVTNSGTGVSVGTVTVTDALPIGLNAISASGTGWTTSIVGSSVTATRSDVLAIGASYPVLNVIVSVSNNAPLTLTNSARVSGGGESNTTNDTANDLTTIVGTADLTISKSHVGNFHQGDASDNYSINVTNLGTGPTTGVVTVTDVLPAGLIAVSATGSGWSTSINGSTVTATRLDALTAGTSYPLLTVTVSVANNAASSITNRASVAGGGEAILTNDSADDVTAIVSFADLTLTKSHLANFQQGDASDTYVLVVNNVGAGPSNGLVTLTDILPSGLTPTGAVGIGWTASINGSTVTATRSDSLIGSGSYPTLTVTVRVANDAPASVTNTAYVSGGGESNLANDTASNPTNIDGVADLTITKSHSDTFRQGDSGHAFTLVVTNAGGGSSSGLVTITDTIPVGLNAVSAIGTGWTTSVVGALVTATRSDALAASTSFPALVITTSVSNTAAASVINIAQVAGGSEINIANDSASDIVAIAQASDLTITKSHVGSFHQASTNAQYLIAVSNVGAGATTGQVIVTDTLPAGLTPTLAIGTGWTTSISGSVVTATRSDALASNASYPSLTITAAVATDTPASVTNTATIAGGGELNTTNDLASDPTTITPPVSDLVIRKTHSATFRQGDTADSYFLVVSNSGSASTAGEVVVTDTLPNGLTAITAVGTGWTTSISDSIVTARRNDLLSASTDYSTLTVTVRVSNDAPTQLTNTAQVSGGGETDASNDSTTDLTMITQVADLTVTKSHTGAFVQGDTRDSYNVVVHNGGTGNTDGQVVVTDTLPTGLTAIEAAGTGWTTSIAGSVITAQRSDVLADNASYPTLVISVRVANDAPTSITNSVQVSGGGELNMTNDSASDVTIVLLPPDLQSTTSHSGTVRQGDTADPFIVEVKNVGASPTSGIVTATITLPTGLTPTSATGTGWSTSIVGNIVTATRSDAIASGASYPLITIMASVSTTAPSSVTNSVQVIGGGEINTSNNTSVDVISIEVASSKLSGYVYLDAANTGNRLKTSGGALPGLSGISINLLKQDAQGIWHEVAGKSPTTTSSDGSFAFDGLIAATYRIQVQTPPIMLGGTMSVGSVANAPIGHVSNRQIEVPLVAGGIGSNYNFGMLGLKPTAISRRLSLASTPPLTQLWPQINASSSAATSQPISTSSIVSPSPKTTSMASIAPGEGESHQQNLVANPVPIAQSFSASVPSIESPANDNASLIKRSVSIPANLQPATVSSIRGALASAKTAKEELKTIDSVFGNASSWWS